MSDNSYLTAIEEAAKVNRGLFEKQYDAEMPKTVEYDFRPSKDWFRYWAEQHPDKPYIVFAGSTMSYGSCNSIARRLANAMHSLGVNKGDRVAVMAPNVPHYLLGMHAAWKLGCIEVPTNAMYTVSELTTQINDSGAETVIVMSTFAAKAAAMLADDGCCVKRVIVFRLPGDKTELPKAAEIYDFDELVASAPDTEPEVEVSMDEPVRLQYTGGTTGVPKGCVLTNRMVYSMAKRAILWTTRGFSLVAEDEVRTLAAIPLCHVYGFNMNIAINLVVGGSIVLVPQPKPDALTEAIVNGRPNIFGSVPAMLICLVNKPEVRRGEVDFTCLKGIFCGGSSCPVAVMKEFESLTGATVVEGYGMSETTNILTINPMRSRRPGTVGVGIPDTDLVVVDAETGTHVMPSGSDGELICRGPQVISEYWEHEKETANAIRGGWLYTGDIVSMDDDGFITIRDRKKDMIIVSSFNVFPREIDEVMFANPKVMEACTFGTPHPKRGEAPVMYIVLREGETMDAAEAEAYLRRYLTGYKIPVDYRFVAELPKTQAGKPDRKALAAMYKEETEQE